MTIRPLALALVSALVLVGCAKVGALERPAPLFGAKAKAHYRAEKAAEAAAQTEAAKKAKSDQPEPLPDEPPPLAPPQ